MMVFLDSGIELSGSDMRERESAVFFIRCSKTLRIQMKFSTLNTVHKVW
jgi:hypothetical protein